MGTVYYDVAVIGAGFTGAALAIQLTGALPRGSRVVLLGAPDTTGRGLAYSTKDERHLLNVRASRLSLFPDDPAHFVRWLAERDGVDPADLAEAYVPRCTYGDYVTACLGQATSEPMPRVHLSVVGAEAVSLRRHDRGFEVGLANGRRIVSGATALCLGHQASDFPIASEALDPEALDRMIADPWTDPRLSQIPKDARVLLVGTGLTMVDQVLTLVGSGHRGRIMAISRHGKLPTAHLPRRQNPIEVTLNGEEASLRDVFREVVTAARKAEAEGSDWRAVIDGIRESTQDIWHAFDQADRRRFLRHAASLWSVHRHRMAPSVGAEVDSLVRRRSLEVRAARLVAVWHRLGRVMPVLKDRGSPVSRVESFDWIINCSGLGRVRASTMQPVLAEAAAHGLLRIDAGGLGLDVTPDSTVIGRHGAATAGLFALGPLTAGRFFEITAIPEIRVQCSAVALRIAALVDLGKTSSASVEAEERLRRRHLA